MRTMTMKAMALAALAGATALMSSCVDNGVDSPSAMKVRDDTPGLKPLPVATATGAAAVFERLKSLAGEWSGTSSEGTESLRYETIASGSCVMETCIHSGEKMVTMFHMDGEKLMLTHYCMAKNQPRMRAGQFVGPADNPTEVTFAFIDGANLPSRDKGHMDKARYKFIDADHFTSSWTWYQDGKEQWMEEFVYTRKK